MAYHRLNLSGSFFEQPRILKPNVDIGAGGDKQAEQTAAIMSDSGRITEETSVIGIPCMILRNSTERPETVDIGTYTLLGVNL